MSDDRIVKRIVTAYIRTVTNSSSLKAHRQYLLDKDVSLSNDFAKSVREHIRAKAAHVDPENDKTPAAHIHGNGMISLQVFTHPGEHRQMEFTIEIPSGVFHQFAFSKDKISITESYSDKLIEPPSIRGCVFARDVGDRILGAIREYVASGGEPLSGLSTIPQPRSR